MDYNKIKGMLIGNRPSKPPKEISSFIKIEDMIDMIDIMEIRNANYLKFYVKEKYIYCENTITSERVIVEEINGGEDNE